MTAESPRIPRGTISFIVITAFLNLAGVGILAPVMTFIVGRYVTDPQAHTWTVSLLFMSYSLCQFIATPSLGALSDRYGRRPILLISLFGSAIGYLLLGIGGAVWVLFAGRIIDGITGGNIGTIYAYAADITTPQERTRFYGTLGAASGLGFVVGPIIGGGLYSLTGLLEAPMYAAALITLLNVIWGYFVMPESLTPERRDSQMDWARANPLTQLISVFRVPQIRLLLIAILLWTTSHSVIQSNLAHLTEDQLGWLPAQTNLLFVLIGMMQIVSQLYLIRILVPRFGEGRVALMGMVGLITGLAFIGTAALTGFAPLVFVSAIFNASGNGLIIPTTSALLSQAVGRREQGRIQGGNQSVQALGRVLGPIYGGFTYTSFSAPVTYYGAAGIMLVTLTIAVRAMRRITAHREVVPASQETQTVAVVTAAAAAGQSPTITH